MKAVFFDIDGTLIEGTNPDFRYMTQAVRRAIRRLQEEGHRVFICSGRSLAFLDEKILAFGFDGYVLLNGSVVFFQDKLIFSEPLDRDFVRKICRICDERGMQYSLHGDRLSYVKPEFAYLMDRLETYGIYKNQLCMDYDPDKIDVYKLEIDSPNYSDREYIVQALPDGITYVGDTKDVNKKEDAACHIEVYAEKNSKATGILKVLEVLNIDIKDSYAFGDGDNDLEMLSAVGLGMAMGNASLKAKAAAKIEVPSVFEDGVAYGIEKYILDEKQ